MSGNWGYVVAGYVITAVAVGGYAASLWYRLRRAEPARRDEIDA
ncbi:MAG: hypothetical protein ACT4OX_09915 [Actinomycetota bacterium]